MRVTLFSSSRIPFVFTYSPLVAFTCSFIGICGIICDLETLVSIFDTCSTRVRYDLLVSTFWSLLMTAGDEWERALTWLDSKSWLIVGSFYYYRSSEYCKSRASFKLLYFCSSYLTSVLLVPDFTGLTNWFLASCCLTMTDFIAGSLVIYDLPRFCALLIGGCKAYSTSIK